MNGKGRWSVVPKLTSVCYVLRIMSHYSNVHTLYAFITLILGMTNFVND